MWGGWSIFDSYGLSPGDGGLLRPFWQRALFGSGVAAIGVAFFAGMRLYASIYVLELAVDGDGVAVDTMALSGRRRRRYRRADFTGNRQYAGRTATTGAAPSVNAPWLTLALRGRRLPLVVDLQAETVRTDRLRALSRGTAKDR